MTNKLIYVIMYKRLLEIDILIILNMIRLIIDRFFETEEDR